MPAIHTSIAGMSTSVPNAISAVRAATSVGFVRLMVFLVMLAPQTRSKNRKWLGKRIPTGFTYQSGLTSSRVAASNISTESTSEPARRVFGRNLTEFRAYAERDPGNNEQ